MGVFVRAGLTGTPLNYQMATVIITVVIAVVDTSCRNIVSRRKVGVSFNVTMTETSFKCRGL